VSPAAGTPPAVVPALQAALAAEHAAVFGYGAAGGRLAGAQRTAAQRDWAAHEAARDTLTAMLLARGAKPVAAQASYALPFTVTSAAAATALAAFLEDRVTAAYLGLVALDDSGLRAAGARAARSAAMRAAGWRGATLAFPGLRLPPAQPPSSASPTPSGSRSPGGTSPSPAGPTQAS
jgi:uncharacterized protein DUF4439